MRVAQDRLRYQRGPGRMDGQVQPADHGPDGDVEGLFGNPQDLLDPGVAAAADQDQAKAADIDHQRLFGDVAEPEQHPRQRRQHGHAGPDHPGSVVTAISARGWCMRVGTCAGTPEGSSAPAANVNVRRRAARSPPTWSRCKWEITTASRSPRGAPSICALRASADSALPPDSPESNSTRMPPARMR